MCVVRKGKIMKGEVKKVLLQMEIIIYQEISTSESLTHNQIQNPDINIFLTDNNYQLLLVKAMIT